MENHARALRPFEKYRSFMEDYIAHGIETNRKGFFKVKFVDKEGKPVQGIKVKAEQKTHDFKFGANCFMLDEIPEEGKNQAYKDLFKDLFNLATVPFYWKDVEPEQDQPRYAKDTPKIYRRPSPDLCIEFCEKNGITPKEHCLVYDGFTPDWVPNQLDTIKKLYEKRFDELSSRYAERVPGWEVINETLFGGKTVLAQQPDMVEWAFKLAEKYFPNNELIINESNFNWDRFRYNRSAYYMQIQRALDQGCRIDAVGFQYHMFFQKDYLDKAQMYYDPLWMAKVMKQYRDFGLPLQMTEVTIPAFSGDAEGQEIQAEILRNMYSLWFAAPGMEAIIYWNLIDGYAYRAEPGDMTAGENVYFGGLVNFDGTPKKGYQVLHDLIHKEWHTSAQAQADADGDAMFKGFFGKYDLEFVTPDGKKETREADFGVRSGDNVTIVVE